MPLAMDAESLEPWLDPDMTEPRMIRNVVHHLDPELITHWPVSQRVNKLVDDDAELIEPVNGP